MATSSGKMMHMCTERDLKILLSKLFGKMDNRFKHLQQTGWSMPKKKSILETLGSMIWILEDATLNLVSLIECARISSKMNNSICLKFRYKILYIIALMNFVNN